MEVTIDRKSGFCFGVVSAIKAAEAELSTHGQLYCLGDIVHNNREVERLKKRGLIMIDHAEFKNLQHSRVMIRAHGEPPETYEIARRNNIELIDASCPVVLKLQQQIRKGYLNTLENGGQIVITGKEGHAEVNGLVGQTENTAIIVAGLADLNKIDFSKDVYLYSQTTMSLSGFNEIVAAIQERLSAQSPERKLCFIPHDTICRQVSSRGSQLRNFAAQHQLILFVSDTKSSNGTSLFQICHAVNPRSYFVTGPADLNPDWFCGITTVGISGATSTPPWVMEEIKTLVETFSSHGG